MPLRQSLSPQQHRSPPSRPRSARSTAADSLYSQKRLRCSVCTATDALHLLLMTVYIMISCLQLTLGSVKKTAAEVPASGAAATPDTGDVASSEAATPAADGPARKARIAGIYDTQSHVLRT